MGRESPGAWAKKQAGGGEGGSCPSQQGCSGWAPCPQPPLEPTMRRAMGTDDYCAAVCWGSRGGPCPGGCQGRLGVEAAPRPRCSPSPKCATGSISQRYPDPPSMMRRWAPLRRVNSTTLAPRAKAPKRVRGMTRSQLLLVPCKRGGSRETEQGEAEGTGTMQ